jgi:hypothetical protein
MKKFGINIQLFLRHTLCLAGLQDFTPIVVFFNTNKHSMTYYLTRKKNVIIDTDNDFIRDVIYKKETQRFELPKQTL